MNRWLFLLLSPLLAPLTLLYYGIIKGRNFAYDRKWLAIRRLPGKTISVGNITVGGTGKSPVVMALAQLLQAQGHQPAILTRGYQSGLDSNDSLVIKGTSVIIPALRRGSYCPDEAMMQSAKLGDIPVIVGARRWEAAQRYLQHFPPPTIWILDDGFQHRQIARDVDLVLVNKAQGFGNRTLLPWGILREPISHLRRCHAIGMTASTDEAVRDESLQTILDHLQIPLIPITFKSTEYHPVHPLTDSVPNRTVVATAIARPQRVIRDVEKFAVVAGTLIKRDHQKFSRADILNILEATHPDSLITTAKDYWRDPEIFQDMGVPCFVLEQTLTWNEDQVRALIQLKL